MTLRVIIAMSGGVDSSVAAVLLKQQGFDVIGIMLRLWNENNHDHNRCCAPDAMIKAKLFANKIEIPFYVIDVGNDFYKHVVQNFLDNTLSGVTPNPCIWCNQYIRWGVLLKQMRRFGASYLATGHYAKIKKTLNGMYQLKRSVDNNKDQTYFLYRLNQFQLSKTLLPLGHLKKDHVRQIAKNFDQEIANRPDSQDLCFLANKDYRTFVKRHSNKNPTYGDIKTTNGEIRGEHEGLEFYTIGQRKGLGISSKSPMYVIEKQIETNTLVVGTKSELRRTKFSIYQTNWISGEAPPTIFNAQVKIRYNSADIPAIITTTSMDQATVDLLQPIEGVTPGQSAVFYNDANCLGGGIIQ